MRAGKAFSRRLFMGVSLAALAACGRKSPSKLKDYNGPKVTSIVVRKSERKMYLLNGSKVLKSFKVRLGFTPEGHKQFEGDGKTPEGTYYIAFKNPNSVFHLSLYISYPNEQDRAFAASQGRKPGGDIVIHGGPRTPKERYDWTEGCVAVSNEEMEIIYSMVEAGTPIHIQP